jgi:ATP-dependent RNA helicase DDX54/DBP10
MPRRAVSPAHSEAEVDILGSLFTDATDDGKTDFQASHAKDGFGFDAGGILDDDGDNDDADGDEAFIALKQAASFRKNSNVKGKSVKKGGGFQAMGMCNMIWKAFHWC